MSICYNAEWGKVAKVIIKSSYTLIDIRDILAIIKLAGGTWHQCDQMMMELKVVQFRPKLPKSHHRSFCLKSEILKTGHKLPRI